VLSGASAAARAASSGTDAFVAAKGTHFVRQGRPYQVAGTKLWYGGYLGAPTGVGQRERLQARGIDNVPVPVLSEKTAMTSAVGPATISAPDPGKGSAARDVSDDCFWVAANGGSIAA
jgi:mannan endo-1,4-beta-mannosidase